MRRRDRLIAQVRLTGMIECPGCGLNVPVRSASSTPFTRELWSTMYMREHQEAGGLTDHLCNARWLSLTAIFRRADWKQTLREQGWSHI
jgi:hypothetical protein